MSRLNRVLVAQTLKISISSLDQQGEGFVWPDGLRRQSPYFFTIQRVSGSVASTAYRADAQILDHLGDNEPFEVASADGVLRARAEPDWRRWLSGAAGMPAAMPPARPLATSELRSGAREQERIAIKLVIATVVSVIVASVSVLAMGRCVVFGVSCQPLVAEYGVRACEGRETPMGCARELPPGAASSGETRRGAAPIPTPLAQEEHGARTHPGDGERAISLAVDPVPAGPGPDGAARQAYAFDEALTCAHRTPCAAPACFQAYGEMALGDSRRASLAVALARARARCTRSQVGAFDGIYAAWLEPGCGERGQGFSIEIRGSSISWRLGVAPAREVAWSGRVDEAGRIRATAQAQEALIAVGDVQAREIRLRSADCQPGEARVARLFARQGN